MENLRSIILGTVWLLGGLVLMVYFIPKLPKDIQKNKENQKLTGWLSKEIKSLSKQVVVINIISISYGFLFLCWGIIILILGGK